MITLLDINVLIALVDSAHVHHLAAKCFFKGVRLDGWATCPLTENGFLRILGRPGASHGPDSPTSARVILGSLLATPGHVFWPDDLSLADRQLFPHLPSAQDLTDLYLLGLAVKHGGRLATFDRRLDATLVPGGPAAYHVIPVA
jgi:toxin-antitoxin system PIN domain toxin